MGKLRGLQHLQVSFAGGSQLSEVSALGESVGKLTGLQHLQISFDGCSQLSDISCWGPSLATHGTIDPFELSFSGCVGLPGDIAQRFVSMPSMVEVMPFGFMLLHFL